MKAILQGRRLILGSKSPRRSQLLKELDIPFVQKVEDTDESFPDSLKVSMVAEFIAHKKAMAIIPRMKDDDIILTADTIVVCDDVIYGKPKDEHQAKEYIKTLSDNVHQVITGVCILDKDKNVCFSGASEVKLRPISDTEIDYYIDAYMPLDKAGAYGIQEWFGHSKIEWIKGTYTNIMGLPTDLVYDNLKSFVER